MTVEANTAEYVDDGDGVTTVFPFPSRFMSNDDITVALDGVVVTTGFSITGAGNPSGGNITFSVAPADGVKVARLRDPAIRQLVDFAGVSGVRPTTMGDIADRQTMVDMALARRQERTLRVSDFEASPPDLTLPAAEDRPNTVVGFDEDGDLVLLPQTEGNVGAPAILELGTGALHLSKFGSFATGASHVTALQTAFDAAISEGRPLRGFYPDAGLFNCDAPLILRSGLTLDFRGLPAKFRRLYTTGSWIEGLFTTPNYDTLDGGADLSDIQEDITLLGVHFDDDGNTRRGSFLTMKCDRLKIQGLHGVKLSAGWTTQFMGIDITMDDIYLNSYDASDDDLPEGTQVWSDTLHFSFVPGLKLTNVRAYAQDDCIAFTLDPAAWATMLPKRDPVSRNIYVGGGLHLRSKLEIIRIGCVPIYGGSPQLCDADVGYDNLMIEGALSYKYGSDPANTGPVVRLEDDREDATQRHNNITIRDTTGENTVEANGTEALIVQGYRTGYDTSIRNFDKVVYESAAVTTTEDTSGQKIYAYGARELVMRGLDLSGQAPVTVPATFGLNIFDVDEITLSNSRIQHRGTSGVAAFSNYDKLRITDTEFMGGPAGAGATVTMTLASPCVVTDTAHGMVANTPIVFTTTGALLTGVTAGTTYYVSATGLTANTYQFSATPGGASINTSGSQSGVHTRTVGDEFDGVYLAPNAGARLYLRGIMVSDTARAFRIIGTHGAVQAADIDLVNVTSPTLPAEIDMAIKKGLNPVLGYALCSTVPALTAASFNASGVAKNGTGDFTITWATTLPSGTYPISVSPGTVGLIAFIIARTTTTVRVGFKDAAGTATDPTGEFGVVAYGFL